MIEGDTERRQEIERRLLSVLLSPDHYHTPNEIQIARSGAHAIYLRDERIRSLELWIKALLGPRDKKDEIGVDSAPAPA